jgi:DNA-binding CsgD family transcriptional regulator
MADPSAGFRRRAVRALAAVDGVDRPGEAVAHVIAEDMDEAEIARLLDDAHARVQRRILAPSGASEELHRLYVSVSDLREELSARLSDRRLAALLAVRAALSRLRGAESLASLMRRGTQELCATCGFDRAMIWRVDSGEAIAESICIPGDPAFAGQVLEQVRAHPPILRHPLIETDMLRRGTAALVRDAAENPRVYKPFVDLIGARSYVVAPIMPQGRVIGFLHADLVDSARAPDELDRDVLATFAEGFGYAVESTILLERLRVQRDHVTQLLTSTQGVMSTLAAVDVELVGSEDSVGGPAGVPAAGRAAASSESALPRVLTRREIDVLRIVATGASNAGIAEELVISEGTVKCHMRSILRKLNCANRGQAISRYLGLVEARPARGR